VELLHHLEQAGLTPVEARVYLALVERGPLLAGELARAAGVHRRLVYDATERLLTKGLVGHVTKNKRTYFDAVPPERIVELHDEKRQQLAGLSEQLQLKWRSMQARQPTLVFEGIGGLKSAFEDQLREGHEILIISSSELSSKAMRHYFRWFDERRKKAGVKVRIIFEQGSETVKIPLATIRYLPKEHIGPSAINIYGDNVAHVLWSDKPLAIVVRNKEMASGYRKFFEALWKSAKP